MSGYNLRQSFSYFGDVRILHCAIEIRIAQILFIVLVWNSCSTWLWENDVQYSVWTIFFQDLCLTRAVEYISHSPIISTMMTQICVTWRAQHRLHTTIHSRVRRCLLNLNVAPKPPLQIYEWWRLAGWSLTLWFSFFSIHQPTRDDHRQLRAWSDADQGKT